MSPIIVDPAPVSVPAPDPGPLPSAGDRLYTRLEPLAYADADQGYPLKQLAAALMEPRQVLEDVIFDQGDTIGWGPILDADLIPADGQMLEWLAAFGGVQFPASALTVEEKRARIKAAAGFYRGTPRAIIEEVQRTLTGTKLVKVIERPGGFAYRVTVLTRTSETPDPAATDRAARSQKAAGLAMVTVVSDEPIIDEAGVARTIDSIGSAGTTIDGIAVADWE